MSTSDRAEPRARDAGMTLAELMVALGLMALVGSIVAATAIVTYRAVGTAALGSEDASRGNLSLVGISKVLRTAVLPEQLEDQTCTVVVNGQQRRCGTSAITSASSTQVRFFANIEAPVTTTGPTAPNPEWPSLVTLTVEPDTKDSRRDVLVQYTEAPKRVSETGYTYCSLTQTTGCTTKRQVVGRDLRPAQVTPRIHQRVFTYYDYNGAPITASTLGADALRSVSSIDVVIVVQTVPGGRKFAHTSLTRVRLPNAEINLVGS